MADTEQLKEVEVTAQRIYGRPYHMLTEEEKDAIATAFGADREQLDADYLAAYETFQSGLEAPDMIQTGDLYHANWGGALSNLGKAYAGARGMREAKEGKEKLSVKERLARRAAADVGAYEQGQQMRMQADALRAANNSPQVADVAATTANPGTGMGQAPQVNTPPPPPRAFDQSGGVPLRPGQQGAPMPQNAFQNAASMDDYLNQAEESVLGKELFDIMRRRRLRGM